MNCLLRCKTPRAQTQDAATQTNISFVHTWIITGTQNREPSGVANVEARQKNLRFFEKRSFSPSPPVAGLSLNELLQLRIAPVQE